MLHGEIGNIFYINKNLYTYIVIAEATVYLVD